MTKPALLLILALAAALLAAAPAHAGVTVTGAAPADKRAGAHSDFTLSFELSDSTRSVRDIDIDLPPGLIGNPNAPGKCTREQFESDSCPPESKVGTQTVNVTVLLVPTDVNGEIFNLVPNAGEPARLGITLNAPPPVGTIRLESSVRVRSESDYGLTSSIRNIPNDFPINSISLTLNGQANGGNFMTNPTSCALATTRVRATAYDDSQASGDGSFTPENCAALAFAPRLSTTLGVDGNGATSTNPSLTSVIEQGPDEANPKSATVVLGGPLGPNVNVLSNVCSVADFNANTCPDRSIVGQASAISPTLPGPLSGPVRIVENPGKLPSIVVYLSGVIDIRLSAEVAVTSAGTSTTFPSLPDVPLSRFQLDFAGGANGLVATAGDLCATAPTISNELTAHSGKTFTLNAPATVVGCKQGGGGDTPGVKKNPPLASVALRRLARKRPLLVANVKRRTPVSRRLRRVEITLPRGLTFGKGRFGAVRTTGFVSASFKGRRTLVARVKPADERVGLVVTNGGLRVSKSLRRRVKRHPRVTVKVVTTDTGGRKSTLRKRVRVR